MHVGVSLPNQNVVLFMLSRSYIYILLDFVVEVRVSR